MRSPVLVSLAVLWGAACSSERHVATDPRYAAATRISISCGGGFAGAYEGTTVHRDGRIETWVESAGHPAAERRAEHRADAAAVAELFALAERIAFLDLAPGEPSNWCCSVALGDGVSAFRVHYEDGPAAALGELVASIRALEPSAGRR